MITTFASETVAAQEQLHAWSRRALAACGPEAAVSLLLLELHGLAPGALSAQARDQVESSQRLVVGISRAGAPPPPILGGLLPERPRPRLGWRLRWRRWWCGHLGHVLGRSFIRVKSEGAM